MQSTLVPGADSEFATRLCEWEQKLRRMTLIVGIFCTDGIILAADKNALSPPSEYDKPDTLDDIFGVRKIRHVEKHKLAYAFAGDELAIDVGNELFEQRNDWSQDSNIGSRLQELARTAYNNGSPKFLQRGWNPQPAEFLIAFYGWHQLWHLSVGVSVNRAVGIDGMKVSGAKGNAARFFIQYYDRVLPIRSSKFLAAHTVLAGHRIDGTIDGLDMAVMNGNGFHWLEEGEKNKLRKRSERLDQSIRKQLFD
jgi:hypothetical protein